MQPSPPEPGTVLLLNLASVEFRNAGSILFRIPRDLSPRATGRGSPPPATPPEAFHHPRR